MSELFPEIDNRLTVTGAELAEWLACTPQAVSKAKQEGRLPALPDGRFDLKACVLRWYGAKLEKRERQTTVGLDAQLKCWQVENAKAKNLSWRREYGQQLIVAFVKQLSSALAEFRKAVAPIPEAVRAGLTLAAAVNAQDVEEVLDEVSDEPGEVQDDRE